MTNSHVAIHQQNYARKAGPSVTRRDFWCESLRAAALIALSAMTVRLGLRRADSQAGADCRRSICEGCSRVAACSLPQAQIFRKSLQGSRTNDTSPEGKNLAGERRKPPLNQELGATRFGRSVHGGSPGS